MNTPLKNGSAKENGGIMHDFSYDVVEAYIIYFEVDLFIDLICQSLDDSHSDILMNYRGQIILFLVDVLRCYGRLIAEIDWHIRNLVALTKRDA